MVRETQMSQNEIPTSKTASHFTILISQRPLMPLMR